MGEILSLHFSRILFTELNSCGIKSFSLRSLALGELLRKEVKSSSLHRAKGMQGPCPAFHLSSAFLISLYLLFFLPISFRDYCFISSLLRHFYYLNHTLVEILEGQKVCEEWFDTCIHAGKESTTFWNPGSMSFYWFLVLPTQLCLSYLFTLIRLPRLAERRLDI